MRTALLARFPARRPVVVNERISCAAVPSHGQIGHDLESRIIIPLITFLAREKPTSRFDSPRDEPNSLPFPVPVRLLRALRPLPFDDPTPCDSAMESR